MPMTRRSVPRRCLMARSQSKERAGPCARDDEKTTDAHRRRGCRRHRHRRQRERRCVLLAVVGLGRARVPRPDDRAADPRSGGRAGSAADRVRDRSWARSRSGSRCRPSGRSARRRRCAKVERMLVYVARRACGMRSSCGAATGQRVFAGALIGIALVSSYGLATRLFPDRFDASDRPVQRDPARGAASGTGTPSGCSSAMGVILAVGVVAHSRRRVVRARRRSNGSALRGRPVSVVLARILARPVLRARRDGRARPPPHHPAVVAAGACSGVDRRCRRSLAAGCSDDGPSARCGRSRATGTALLGFSRC